MKKLSKWGLNGAALILLTVIFEKTASKKSGVSLGETFAQLKKRATQLKNATTKLNTTLIDAKQIMAADDFSQKLNEISRTSQKITIKLDKLKHDNHLN